LNCGEQPAVLHRGVTVVAGLHVGVVALPLLLIVNP
jgi:hypothetical protein